MKIEIKNVIFLRDARLKIQVTIMSLSKYVVYIYFCEQEHLSFSKRNFHILPNSKTTEIV